MALLVAACTKAPDEKADHATDVAEVGGRVIEIGDVFNFKGAPADGTQVRLERITLTEDATVVELGVTNGNKSGTGKSIRFGTGETYAVTGEGVRLELVSPLDYELEAGEDAVLYLEFEPAENADELTVYINQNSSITNPKFELGPYSLVKDSVRPTLPDPQAANEVVSDPDGKGIQLHVTGVTFAPTRIGLRVRLSNAGDYDKKFRSYYHQYVLDDLGNRYPLMFPPDESTLTLPAGQARAGVLSFAGRVHPQATSLELRLGEESMIEPTLIAKVWNAPKDGDASTDGDAPDVRLPADLAPKDAFNHPNGTQIELQTIKFTPKTIEANVAVTNAGRYKVDLAFLHDYTWLEDDLGNRYPLVPPADNPNLKIAAGSGLEGTLVFSGRLVPDASTVMIVINGHNQIGVDGPKTSHPQFHMGPYPVNFDADRSAKPAEVPVFAVGERTTLVDEKLVSSEMAEMELIMSNFDAVEVKEGILLTVSEALLFDFDRADLRPDARQTLAQIAELLRYYDGEPVLIVGHTDSLGSAAYNKDLSEQRANNVLKALLADHGIERARLSSEGRGKLEPVAPNTKPDGSDDPDGRQRNRRVEVTILTDRGLPGK